MRKWQVRRDFRRRLLVRSYELERLALKRAIFNELQLENQMRLRAMFKLDRMPKNSSRVRVRNRCVITGRPRGVLRRFKMSRIMLRQLGSNGLLPGLTKSSF